MKRMLDAKRPSPPIDSRYSKAPAKRPRLDGRYSTVYATTATVDEWDEITAVESPTALASEPPMSRKRSGEYQRHELADAHRRAAKDEQ